MYFILFANHRQDPIHECMLRSLAPSPTANGPDTLTLKRSAGTLLICSNNLQQQTETGKFCMNRILKLVFILRVRTLHWRASACVTT